MQLLTDFLLEKIENAPGEPKLMQFVEKNLKGVYQFEFEEYAIVKKDGELKINQPAIFIADSRENSYVYMYYEESLGAFIIYQLDDKSKNDIDTFMRKQAKEVF